jgi:hypothetical protein
MNAPALQQLLTPPRIGQPWPAAGGIYLGITPNLADTGDDHLVMSPEWACDMTWQQAMDWAAALRSGGFADWQLGDQTEGALAYAHARHLFEHKGWHWLRTQYSRSFAWLQFFFNGSQVNYGKRWQGGAARAFRRFSVQSFGHFDPAVVVTGQVAQLRLLSAAMTSAADAIDCARSRAAAEARDEAQTFAPMTAA